jgi:hypothetical protein
MVDFVFLAAACLVGYVAQEEVEPHPYTTLEKARERLHGCCCASKDGLQSIEHVQRKVRQRRTYYGEENCLVVCPCEQNSSVEMILHCRQKSQNEAHHHNRC